LAATEHKRQPDHGNRAHWLLVSAMAMANHGPRLHLRQGESLGIGGQKRPNYEFGLKHTHLTQSPRSGREGPNVGVSDTNP